MLLIAAAALSTATAQNIIKPSVKTKTSFAIVIDNKSYEEAKDAVEAYRRVVEKDGLGTYIVSDDWKKPEDIRAILQQFHSDKNSPLEGVVLVGDIPIPMIRDAQHMTSAFKMDQRRNWQWSSIPSDRYYDDFGLKFDFLKQDSIKPLYFYYSLRYDSRQVIKSDIYSARMKPLEKGKKDKYTQLRDYLNKVVAERTSNPSNKIDYLTMARGHGYNSESKVAWSGEQLALREQFPNVFRPGHEVKFIDFESYWPAKPYYLNEVQRPELDIMLFHHHGAEDTQYLNGYKNTSDAQTSIENVKLYLRSKVLAAVKKGKSKDEAINQYVEWLGVPREWCETAFDPKLVEQDSIMNLSLDIHVSDVLETTPNARFVMFDACYNGSFYEDQNIAGAYIFNDGKTIVTQGNTVNALQDKWPDEFIGLMDAGVRVGQWHKYVQYLETHIVGDPTYRFANSVDPKLNINEALTLKENDVNYWRGLLNHESADVQAIAMRVLYDNGYNGLSKILKDKYFSSPYGVVRMEAVELLALLGGQDLVDVLKATVLDSYELVRRLSVDYIGQYGSDELASAVATSMVKDNTSKRVQFKVSSAVKLMNTDVIKAELTKAVENLPLYDRKEIEADFKMLDSTAESRRVDLDSLRSKTTTKRTLNFELSIYRNNPSNQALDVLFAFVKDKDRDSDLRLKLIEAFGWYNYSERKAEIITVLDQLQAEEQNLVLKHEMIKTINRLR